MNFFYFLKKKKILLENLEKYKEYLVDGEYILSPHIVSLKGFNLFKEEVNKLATILIFNKTYTLKSNNKCFNGKLLYISDNVKIFSEKYVLGFEGKENYDIIKNYFNIPKIEFFDKYYLEERIKGEKASVEEVLQDLLRIYKKVEAEENLIKCDNFSGFSKEIFIKTHGDVHIKNVIKKNKTLYYIDYDSFGEYLFYYDFINLLFAPAINKDFRLLKGFLMGKYDNYFKELFAIFDRKFKKDERLKYLQTYLNVRIERFDKNLNNLKKYKGILKCVV
jgi:hypothetical protein